MSPESLNQYPTEGVRGRVAARIAELFRRFTRPGVDRPDTHGLAILDVGEVLPFTDRCRDPFRWDYKGYDKAVDEVFASQPEIVQKPSASVATATESAAKGFEG